MFASDQQQAPRPSLSEQELKFARLLNSIYDGTIKTHLKLETYLKDTYPAGWRTIAGELLNARQHLGPEMFWNSYNTMARQYRPLDTWRYVVDGTWEREYWTERRRQVEAEQRQQQKVAQVKLPASVDEVPTSDLTEPAGSPEEPEWLQDFYMYKMASGPEELFDSDEEGRVSKPDAPREEVRRKPPVSPVSVLRHGRAYSQIEGRSIEWLWDQRIAFGKLTIIDGDPGQGKSMLTVDLAARVSQGWKMPDDSRGLATGAGVIFITPEDDPDDTIQPRLLRAGADLTRVYDLSTAPMGKLSPDDEGYEAERDFMIREDLERLEEMIEDTGARLVIIDPITSVLGDHDMYRDNEVRALLSPLRRLLKKKNVAGVIVRHLNKSNNNNVLYRGGGSIAFIGAVRSGMMVVKDPYEPGRSLLVHVKTNIGELSPTLSFSVEKDLSSGKPFPHILWHGTREYTWQEIFNPPSEPSQGHPKPPTTREEVLRVLQEHEPEALSPLEISQELPDLQFAAVRKALSRMVNDGQITQSAYGKYSMTAK